MEINSFTFIFLFLPGILLLFLFTSKVGRPSFLLLASLFFYYWIEGRYAVVLIVLCAFLFLVGTVVERREKAYSRPVFVCSVVLLVLLLGYFKYTGFLVDTINAVRGWLGSSPLRVRDIHLPVGISFYVFTALSYVIDLRRGAAQRRRGLIDVSVYLSFFPKLINGPIVPYRHHVKEAPAWTAGLAGVNGGIRRFVLGLGKKVLIADNLARVAGPIFSIPFEHLDARLAWIGLIAFTLQIYFDFSGYTDMAIGLGRIFGYELPENFRYPYVSRSIREFWSRWHITLSQWFRDYLFLPVAYRLLRALKKERYAGLGREHWSYVVATFVAMLLCGIWHGAGWTFITWGMYYGVLLIVEHLWLGGFLKRQWRPVSHIYLLTMSGLGWVLFRSASLAGAWRYYAALFGVGGGEGTLYPTRLFLNAETALVLIAALAGSMPLFPWIERRRGELLRTPACEGMSWLPTALSIIQAVFIAAIGFLSTLALIGGGYQPFLYMRF